MSVFRPGDVTQPPDHTITAYHTPVSVCVSMSTASSSTSSFSAYLLYDSKYIMTRALFLHWDLDLDIQNADRKREKQSESFDPQSFTVSA